MSDVAEGLALRLDEVEVHVARLDTDVMDLVASAAVGIAGASGPAALAHASVSAWVRAYFCATFVRPLGGEFRWCARWEEHPEAVVRLEALWRSWEALHREAPLGMVTWLTNYLDPQLGVLLSRGGPFAQCTGDRHVGQGVLPIRHDQGSQPSAVAPGHSSPPLGSAPSE